MDDFEQHLRRQPIAPPPTYWRYEVLAAARQGRTGFQPVCASESERPSTSTKDMLEACPTLLAVLRGWLWPHPGAWAALASVWVFIFFMNHQIQVDVQHDIELAGVKAPASDVLNAFEERRVAVEHYLATDEFEFPVLDRPRVTKPRRTGSPPLMLLTT